MSAPEVCKWCEAPVRWVVTAADTEHGVRRLCLNLAPVEDGSGSYAVLGLDSAIYIPVKRRGVGQTKRLYVPHMDTCVRRDDALAHYRRLARDRQEARTVQRRLSLGMNDEEGQG